jgi:hypothetical protein
MYSDAKLSAEDRTILRVWSFGGRLAENAMKNVLICKRT